MNDYFEEMNVIFHQIDFSSNKPISKKTYESYKEMKKLFKEIKFDLIHCHTPIAGAIARVTCKNQRNDGCKVIYTTHGFYFHKGSSWKTRMIFFGIEDYMSRYSDAIITINHEDYANAKKMHCKKIFYIPGVGVNTTKFKEIRINKKEYRKQLGIEEDDFLVLAIGELSHRKNHQNVIKALAEINDSNIVFMICGNAMTDSNTKNELIKLADSLNVELRLMGLRDDIPQICKCADIGVLPSTREGLGLSGIEMLASGLPVVASKVHGIVDYISDGIDGYLCEPYNEHEMAVAIKKLMSESVRTSMKENCQLYAEKFDEKYSHKKMQEIYKEILK